MHRFVARELAIGLEVIVGCGVHRNLERLAHPQLVAPQVVDRAVVGDSKQPGAQRRQFLQLGQLVVCTRKSILDDVLAVGNRAGHARAVAVQFRAHVVDEGEKLTASLVQLGEDRVVRRATHSISS
jgi:hypothetical protein